MPPVASNEDSLTQAILQGPRDCMGLLGLQSPGFRLAPLREHGSRGGRGLEIEDLGCEGEQRMHPMAAIMCATSEAWIRNQTQPWVWDIPTIPALSSFWVLRGNRSCSHAMRPTKYGRHTENLTFAFASRVKVPQCWQVDANLGLGL